MTVNYYRHDDSSAPVLDNTNSSLIGLLDACLVNGYGAKAAAGWTKEFSGTNRAAYRHAVGEAYYRFCDSLADETIGTAPIDLENCTIRGFMSMTDVDTGSNMFPTVAQLPYSGIKKVDGVGAKNWVLVEDNGLVYLTIQSQGSLTLYGGLYVFGKFKSLKATDTYNYCLGASTTNSAVYYPYTYWSVNNQNLFLARDWNGVEESKQCSTGYSAPFNGITANRGNLGANIVDTKMHLTPHIITENDGNYSSDTIRGYLPGLFYPYSTLHATVPPHDTFSSEDATTTYVIAQQYSTSVVLSMPAIQTNLTWDW